MDIKQLKKTKLADLKYIAIQILYIITFGLASLEKLTTVSIPQDFLNQFGGTWMNAFPGGLFVAYYGLALLETTALALFLISFFLKEWLRESDKVFLKSALILSLFIFIALSYGLRLTEAYGGTANAFFYFGVTLFALYLSEKESETSNL